MAGAHSHVGTHRADPPRPSACFRLAYLLPVAVVLCIPDHAVKTQEGGEGLQGRTKLKVTTSRKAVFCSVGILEGGVGGGI